MLRIKVLLNDGDKVVEEFRKGTVEQVEGVAYLTYRQFKKDVEDVVIENENGEIIYSARKEIEQERGKDE